MGRWSRLAAYRFLDWLALPPGLNWLDVGCGTGALSAAICRRCNPASLIGCDPSPDFVSFARRSITNCPAAFIIAGAEQLPDRTGGFDAIAAGFVLNFLAQPQTAVQVMRDRLRPGGTLGAYVWDYAEGMQFLRIFWDEAAALDPTTSALDEANRFPICHPDRLADLFRQAGFGSIATTSFEIDTIFPHFADFWSPLLAGTGTAPAYVATLEPAARNRLAGRLKERLQPSADGSIRLKAAAFGVRGVRRG
jgi:SAM-dependent methyltransferase